MILKMKNWIGYFIMITILNKKFEIDNGIYRKKLYSFFYRTDWNYETLITKIRTFKERGGVTIEITTHRPGLIIGKGGRYINQMTKELSEDLNVPIKIKLNEEQMWLKIHKIK